MGSWSVETCCARKGNLCHRSSDECEDHTSWGDWLFKLLPAPQRFTRSGNGTEYQFVWPDDWPQWGGDLVIGQTSGLPGFSFSSCDQVIYLADDDEICGGDGNWGATDVEVWYPYYM